VSGFLAVSEVFGPTVQGEGPMSGRRCVFLRLGGCNLACSWCDTPYTWDWTGQNGQQYDPRVEVKKIDFATLRDDIRERAGPIRHLVVTGGEPMLQAIDVAAFVDVLENKEQRWVVEMETNGTLAPPSALIGRIDRYNVSPKLINSIPQLAWARRPELNYTIRLEPLAALVNTRLASLKFVIETEDDFDEIEMVLRQLAVVSGRAVPYLRSLTWVMPQARTQDELVARGPVMRAAVERGYNVTTRLQVLLWGIARGH
jgi:organic radical activating enzyme